MEGNRLRRDRRLEGILGPRQRRKLEGTRGLAHVHSFSSRNSYIAPPYCRSEADSAVLGVGRFSHARRIGVGSRRRCYQWNPSFGFFLPPTSRPPSANEDGPTPGFSFRRETLADQPFQSDQVTP